LLKGTAGNGKWTVQYVDHTTGADITAAVTGAGWQTPILSPRAGRRIKILVTPGVSTTVGSALNVLLTGSSTVDAKRKDAVKAVTTRK